jgi:ribose-phosphate pyrophosphokinase
VDKRRERAGECEVMNIIGEVKGRNCILIDDMTDSGGTLINAAAKLLEHGAKGVAAYVTHGVLSNGAAANIDKSLLKELVITDTICASDQVKSAKKIRAISLAPLIGEAIRRIANDESISKMFD